jgi:phytoene synthase
MTRDLHYSIFKRGSRTYFHASLFFPPQVRAEVFTLYAFVRSADDLVDSVPQEVEKFHAFRTRWNRAAGGEMTGDPVIDPFASLVRRRDFEPGWVDSFLDSMALDMTKSRYETMEDLSGYLYGSAEVIGLMMARILGLPDASHPTARLLGRSMQYINFIRDIQEDLGLGRIYLPREEMREFGLSTLSAEEARRAPDAFALFIRSQIDRYRSWEAEAERGFSYIPYRYLIPVKTASELYRWTAAMIDLDPFIVFRVKVRPSLPRILSIMLVNGVTQGIRRTGMGRGDPGYGT